MGPTPEMSIQQTLTFTGADTQSGLWIYTYGYTKLTVSGSWTGLIAGSVLLEGTDEPPEPDGLHQPNPSAVQIDTLDTLTNVKPAGVASTAGARDEYDNVLSRFVRLKMTETATEAGVLTVRLTFKAAS
jgi:hypothetical protein